jgi:phage/plasmid-like protein (TIGR03299 family)
MAHDLSRDADGNVEMMFVGQMPWHDLGTKLENPPANAEQAVKAARLHWSVAKKQLYVGDEHRPLPGEYAVVREDRWARNEEGAIFGTVKHDYQMLQNTEAFTFFDPIVEAKLAFYETAGALGNGERVWVMARITSDQEIVPGDSVSKYLLLSNRHDGRGAIHVKFTPVRVVCRNTLNQALEHGPTLRVAHTLSMKDKLKEVAQAVKRINDRFNELGAAFRRFAGTDLTTQHLNKYLQLVFPEPKRLSDDSIYRRAMRQMQDDRNGGKRLFETGKGNAIKGVAGTLWAAYNGVAEYVDFYKYKTGDRKWLETIWFGAGDAIKTRAFEAALRFDQERR